MLGFISACRAKYININWFFQVLATSLLERYNSTSDEFVFHQDCGLSPGLLLFAYRWSVGRMEKHSSIPARNMLMSFAALHWHFQPHLQSASMRTRKSIWLNLSLARLNTSWEKRKTTVWESSFVTLYQGFACTAIHCKHQFLTSPLDLTLFLKPLLQAVHLWSSFSE